MLGTRTGSYALRAATVRYFKASAESAFWLTAEAQRRAAGIFRLPRLPRTERFC
jgi:hypothetical protein